MLGLPLNRRMRSVPGAEPRAPTLEVAEAVAAVKRYFEGEETDFSGFRLDLGEQDPFFERIYAAARRVAWRHTTSHGVLANALDAGPEAARVSVKPLISLSSPPSQ
jgi:methylated-DNA-[protein]-cysteine S-methyltransferase